MSYVEQRYYLLTQNFASWRYTECVIDAPARPSLSAVHRPTQDALVADRDSKAVWTTDFIAQHHSVQFHHLTEKPVIARVSTFSAECRDPERLGTLTSHTFRSLLDSLRLH